MSSRTVGEVIVHRSPADSPRTNPYLIFPPWTGPGLAASRWGPLDDVRQQGRWSVRLDIREPGVNRRDFWSRC